jgi:hypothetical protein
MPNECPAVDASFPVSLLPVMLMLLTSILVFLPVMMYCIPVVLFLLLRTVVVLAACMMVVAVQLAFLDVLKLVRICSYLGTRI